MTTLFRMSPVTRLRPHSIAALLLLVAVLVGAVGCQKSSTAPAAPPTTQSVTVSVQDSTGAAVAGATVFATGIDDSNAGQAVSPVPTNAAGVSSLTLQHGHWIVFARSGPSGGPFRVAGSSGVVGTKPAGSPDSTVFSLVVRTQSIARGIITLAGRGTHDGTLVGTIGIPTFAITASDGKYELDGLPTGTWVALAQHNGFRQGQFAIVVPGPAQTIAVDPVVLAPNSIERP